MDKDIYAALILTSSGWIMPVMVNDKGEIYTAADHARKHAKAAAQAMAVASRRSKILAEANDVLRSADGIG